MSAFVGSSCKSFSPTPKTWSALNVTIEVSCNNLFVSGDTLSSNKILSPSVSCTKNTFAGKGSIPSRIIVPLVSSSNSIPLASGFLKPVFARYNKKFLVDIILTSLVIVLQLYMLVQILILYYLVRVHLHS